METKDKILAAALELFVEHGLYGVATSQISKKAGVSAGILFHHFETKDKLIAELYVCNKAKYMQDAIEDVPLNSSTEEKLKSIWDNMLLRCSSNPLLSKFCRQIEHSPFVEKVKEDSRIKQINEQLITIFKSGIETGELKNMPEVFFVNLFQSMQSGVVIYLNSNPEKMTDAEFRKSAWDSVWCAMKEKQ